MIACTSMLRDRYYSLSQTIWIWQNPGFLNPLPGWSEKLKVRRIWIAGLWPLVVKSRSHLSRSIFYGRNWGEASKNYGFIGEFAGKPWLFFSGFPSTCLNQFGDFILDLCVQHDACARPQSLNPPTTTKRLSNVFHEANWPHPYAV